MIILFFSYFTFLFLFSVCGSRVKFVHNTTIATKQHSDAPVL